MNRTFTFMILCVLTTLTSVRADATVTPLPGTKPTGCAGQCDAAYAAASAGDRSPPSTHRFLMDGQRHGQYGHFLYKHPIPALPLLTRDHVPDHRLWGKKRFGGKRHPYDFQTVKYSRSLLLQTSMLVDRQSKVVWSWLNCTRCQFPFG